MDLDGKVAIVTGGSRGIGAALASALARNGARVAVADLDGEAAAAHPDAAFGVGTDVADEAALRALIERAETELGPVDLFCANAGVFGPTGLETSDADWSRALDVNVLAHVRAARLMVPRWLEREQGGYFVATASAAGLLTQVAVPSYAVSKHAAVAFAEWLSVTYGDRGVRVSCVCPMGVNTPMMTGGPDADAAQHAGARAVRAAGAVLEPEQIAAAVVEAIGDERFLVLPHPEVLEFFRRKASDYDRWLAGMRRLQASVG